MEIAEVVDRTADGLADHAPHIVAARCLTEPGDALNAVERFAPLGLFVRTVEDDVDVMPALGQEANGRVEVPQIAGVLHDEQKSPALAVGSRVFVIEGVVSSTAPPTRSR